ncbi:hypothetical protein E2C01_101187 [Portunus trituberculatus]|uniref:Uncharacterized protein n=1 Tax=Portunus trituberculatus TaxID=210409 RepID=A0A5B7K527_PORTR|nr:hypothetical protein [Portunus trituberculatus]
MFQREVGAGDGKEEPRGIEEGVEKTKDGLGGQEGERKRGIGKEEHTTQRVTGSRRAWTPAR